MQLGQPALQGPVGRRHKESPQGQLLLGRRAGHGSDSPLTSSAQDFACVEAVGASVGHLLQSVQKGCSWGSHREKSVGDSYVTSECRTSHHANHYKTGIGQFHRKFQVFYVHHNLLIILSLD